MKIGRKIYFDKTTGEVILDTGERKGAVIRTTVERDVAIYRPLTERNRHTFDYIELEYGQYAQDFRECNGYRVNIEKLVELSDDRKHEALEFSYPDPNEEEPQEPIYQVPLSEKVQELETRQDATENALLDLILMGGM